jgi:hypothetical protein
VAAAAFLSAARGETPPNLALHRAVMESVEVCLRRGAAPDSVDPLDATGQKVNAERPAAEIVRVGNEPGAADYREKEDYILTHQGLDWSPRGQEPKPGNHRKSVERRSSPCRKHASRSFLQTRSRSI